MFSSIRTSSKDFIIVIRKIKMILKELVLVGEEHLSYYNIVQPTYYPPATSLLKRATCRVVWKASRASARSIRSYRKMCKSRGSNSSLVELRRGRRELDS